MPQKYFSELGTINVTVIIKNSKRHICAWNHTFWALNAWDHSILWPVHHTKEYVCVFKWKTWQYLGVSWSVIWSLMVNNSSDDQYLVTWLELSWSVQHTPKTQRQQWLLLASLWLYCQVIDIIHSPLTDRYRMWRRYLHTVTVDVFAAVLTDCDRFLMM